MLRKYVVSAYLGVKSARLRSVLTILGITMGIFMVITLLAVGRGAQDDVVKRVTDLGANIVAIQSTSSKSSSQSGFPTSLVGSLAPATLTLDDLNTVKKQSAVTLAVPVRYVAGQLSTGKKSIEPGFVILTTPKYAELRNLKLTQGKFFDEPKSGVDSVPQIVIGKSIKERLFGNENPVGMKLRYGDQTVVVSGILDGGDSADQVDRTVVGPLALTSEPTQRDLYSYIYGEVNEASQVDSTVRVIKKEMSSYRPQGTFSVTSSKELLSASKDVLKVLTAMIGVVAAISLTMSGVGIMNMMIVSVTDRTKEIGVRKTVGASESNIFWQFLFEAVLLTTLGGLIGITITAGAVFAISKLLPIKPLLTPDLVALGLGLSVLVGVLFGVGPAMRAARKEPIEALQTDRS